MARARRRWVSQDVGSFHIISRVAGSELLFNEEDKEFFLKLLERFAEGFFVEIHAFCIMSNHFHILATGLEKEARGVSKEELFRRYRAIRDRRVKPIFLQTGVVKELNISLLSYRLTGRRFLPKIVLLEDDIGKIFKM